jgi:hypothetical protein
MGDQEGTLSFEKDIRAMFREKDRQRMEWAFDLWRYEDVRDNAPGILERIEDGSMPCDEPWPPEQIERLRAWIAAGTPQ